MKDLLIYGGGGHCYAAIELIRSDRRYNPVLVIDTDPSKIAVMGIPIKQQFDENAFDIAIVAIGNNLIRKKVAETIAFTTPNFIHNSAVVYPSSTIGRGAQILPNAVVDAGVSIGDFTIVNNNASVSHNTEVGAFAHIAINAAVAGKCVIGEGVLVGAGSVILPGIEVGAWSVIGAGAVVTKNIPEGSTVVGNPMKIIK